MPLVPFHFSCPILQDLLFNYSLFMPQLLPFYFVNQMTWTLSALFILTWAMSVYVLPYLVALFATRVFVTRL